MSTSTLGQPGVPASRTADLFGQIIPLDADAMLLPNAAVVEVRNMDDISVRSEPPGWLLGSIRWREHDVPVVSLEGVLGRAVPARSRRSRLVVVNSLGTHLDHGLLAFVVQGYPHLTALNRSALQSVAREARDPDALVLARVRVANTLAVIPDLEAIEARTAEILPAAAAETPWEPSLQ
jgi:chemosensory pili system protein ChpC